jgi:DNA-binding MarR family transcriptional regulator
VAEKVVVDAWRELSARHAEVWGALERGLGDKHGLSPSEFEVLERLAESAKGQLRVQELADTVHLSQSAMSRLVARLEVAGMVERTMCADDRRGVFVCITATGRTRHAEAVPTHRAVLSMVLER